MGCYCSHGTKVFLTHNKRVVNFNAILEKHISNDNNTTFTSDIPSFTNGLDITVTKKLQPITNNFVGNDFGLPMGNGMLKGLDKISNSRNQQLISEMSTGKTFNSLQKTNSVEEIPYRPDTEESELPIQSYSKNLKKINDDNTQIMIIRESRELTFGHNSRAFEEFTFNPNSREGNFIIDNSK